MPPTTPAPLPAELLCFETIAMIARTHRGEYVLRFIRGDSEYRGSAWASFHGYDGDHAFVGPSLGDDREVAAACDVHAHAQPAHPPMLGWPACGEVSP